MARTAMPHAPTKMMPSQPCAKASPAHAPTLLYDPSFTHGYRVRTGGDETLAGSTDAGPAAQDDTQGMQGTQDLRDPHDEAHA